MINSYYSSRFYLQKQYLCLCFPL